MLESTPSITPSAKYTAFCSAGNECKYRRGERTKEVAEGDAGEGTEQNTEDHSNKDTLVIRGKGYPVGKNPKTQAQTRKLGQQDPEGGHSRDISEFYAIVDGYECATKVLNSHPELEPTDIAYICVKCLEFDPTCTHIVGSYHSLDKTEPARCKNLKTRMETFEKRQLEADKAASAAASEQRFKDTSCFTLAPAISR